jgi:hypothetical protein
VTFYAGGKAQPALAGGGTVAQQVLSVTGLHWTGYTPGGPIVVGGSPTASASPAGTSPAGTPGSVNPGGVMQSG